MKYLVAVALLDAQVGPEQFAADRINSPDVQTLLRKVVVRPSHFYTRHIPDEMRCKLSVSLTDGTKLQAERTGYDGFFTRPMGWADVTAKFDRLAQPFAGAGLREEIVSTVKRLEEVQAADLARRLARVATEAGG